MLGAPQRVHAIGSQGYILCGAGSGAAQCAFDTGEAAVERCLVANFNVVTWQAGVGTHWTSVLGGDFVVFYHGLYDIAGQRIGFCLLRRFDTGQIVLRYIDGGFLHDFIASRFDGLIRYHDWSPASVSYVER